MPCRSLNGVFLLSQVFSSRESCAFVTSFISRCRLPCPAAQPRRISTLTFPPLNLHKARVRRKHGRPVQTALSKARQASCSRKLSSSKRASDKALALIRTRPCQSGLGGATGPISDCNVAFRFAMRRWRNRDVIIEVARIPQTSPPASSAMNWRSCRSSGVLVAVACRAIGRRANQQGNTK